MLSKKMLGALNDQIKEEMFSSQLYLAMSAWAENGALPGFAKWLRVQAEEERTHAMKFFDYILEQGGKVALQAIEGCPSDFAGIRDIFGKVQEHEKKITGLIHKLYELALKENDYATQIELQWFIKEQVEEEANAALMVDQLKMIGDKSSAILNLDHQAGKRGG